jgi:predicted exporter
VASRERIESDAARLSLAASVLIAVVLLAVLRSVRFLLLAAVPTASGALAGLAVIAAGFGEIHGITLGFGLTLIGEAADYATYVYLQRAPPQDTRANARLWRLLALAVLTSSAGFLAMILSGFRGLTQLGLFSLVGIVVAGAVARWLLPAWLPPANPRLPRLSWPPSRPAVMRGLQVAVAALALGSAVHLAARGASAWNDSLASLSPLAPAAGELDARLRGDAALPELRWVIALERASQEQALQAAEALRQVLEHQRRTGALAAFDSPADLLPSERTQQARRAALPERAELERAFAQAVAGTGFEPQAFAPFLDAVQVARTAPTLARAYYGASGLGSRLDAQLVRRDDGRTALFVTLHGVDPAQAGPLRGAVAAQGAALIDLKGDVESILAEYRRTAVWAALGGAALIVVLLFVQLRSPAVVARVVVALGAAVLITAGALLVVEGALTLFHLVALLLVAGIGTNYAMFFARLPADTALRRATLGSVLLAAFTSFVAFGLLATSATPVLHMIGATVGVGTVAGVAAGAACAASERPAA